MKIKDRLEKLWEIIQSSYLCIRFPFLYPTYYTRNYTSKFGWKNEEIFFWQKKYALEHVDDYEYKFGAECLYNNQENIVLIHDISGELRSFTFGPIGVKDEYVMKYASIFTKIEYQFNRFMNFILQIIHKIPSFTKLNAIPYGWRKRFGIQFCDELKKAILLSGGKKYLKEFVITTIKEKYGTLQVYIDNGTDEVYRVLSKYEYISQFVCVNCGKDAVKQSTGWICPYCEDCIGDRHWIWIDPIYDWSDPKKKEYNEKILKEML